MASRDIALYGQIMNTCGFAATLMMLTPEKNRLSPLLNDITKKIKLDPNEHHAINWQIACGYLLLKTHSHHLLRLKMQSKIQESMDYFDMMLENQMYQKKELAKQHQHADLQRAVSIYMNRGIVRKILLMDYLNEYKTNLELRVLNALFGAEARLFNSDDGTGSLVLTSISEFKKHFSLLIECVKDGLLLGLPGHWVTVKDIQKSKGDFLIQVHDSRAGSKTIFINKSKRKIEARFYAFKYSDEEQLEMEKIIRKALRLPFRKNTKIP
ncbi:MAG: hypothetical protein ACTSSI_00260 [Candidatus Helarchaeota archaeon]